MTPVEYIEIEVPPALRRHVECVWLLQDPAPQEGTPQTIYPDGRCELIVHRGVPMARYDFEHGWAPQQPVLFAGQMRCAIRLAARGPLDCLGIRLRPAASACVVSRPLRELRDRVVDLSGIDADFAGALRSAGQALEGGNEHRIPGQKRREISRQASAQSSWQALWQTLEDRLLRCTIDPRIEQAIEQLESDQGLTRIPSLAAAAAMSLRAFQGGFAACVGLGAKEFARIVRLQATLRALDSGAASLAGIAVEAGYSDQAHATREVRRLTGLTPARLLVALQAGREADAAVRLAAAFVRGAS